MVEPGRLTTRMLLMAFELLVVVCVGPDLGVAK